MAEEKKQNGRREIKKTKETKAAKRKEEKKIAASKEPETKKAEAKEKEVKKAAKATPQPKEILEEAIEARAVARFVRVSPFKARQVVDLVRGKSVEEAMNILKFSPKGAASLVSKVVASAAANAEKNHGMNSDRLYISEAYVNEGPTLKRFRHRAMGRASRIRKRTSHITVVVRERGK